MLLLLCAGRVHADFLIYDQKREISVTNGDVVFRHAHDWGSKQVSKLFLDLPHHEKFFTTANSFSFVEVRGSDGKILFRSPSPALTNLWISPDGQFFVGLSNIMLYNPYQWLHQ